MNFHPKNPDKGENSSRSRVQSSPLADLSDRLVTLRDGRLGLRSGLHVEVSEPVNLVAPRSTSSLSSSGGEGQGEEAVSNSIPANSCNSCPAPPENSSCLDFVASDETLDRTDEIISATGWRLEAYRRNPVFQNAHQYGDIIFTLGKALVTEVRLAAGRPVLFQRVQFATDANPMARIACALYKGKFLNAVSVGFIPIRWENPESSSSLAAPKCNDSGLAAPKYNGGRLPTLDLRLQTLDSHPRRRYLEQELLEVSAVGIPANPNALQLGLKAGAISKADLKELLETVREIFAKSENRRSRSERNPKAESPSQSTGPIDSDFGVRPSFGIRNSHFGFPFPQLFSFRSNPAVTDTHASASGVRNDEAQLLQLARAVRDALKR